MNIPLSLNSDYLTTTVPLRVGSSCSGTAAWSVTFSYQTSGGHGSSTSGPYTHTGNLNETWNLQVPGGVGGKADVAVTINGTITRQDVFYVVGTTIPDDTITNQLVSLYASGVHPRLFTGVATRESSYRQFAPSNLFGQSGRWPYESESNGGQYIGLLQIPASMANGYSYLANTQGGVGIFLNDKLPWCTNWVAGQRQAHPGLRDLTAAEYELCALVEYGPYPNPASYYVPNSDGTNWIVNPNNSGGVAYANSVLGSMK